MAPALLARLSKALASAFLVVKRKSWFARSIRATHPKVLSGDEELQDKGIKLRTRYFNGKWYAGLSKPTLLVTSPKCNWRFAKKPESFIEGDAFPECIDAIRDTSSISSISMEIYSPAARAKLLSTKNNYANSKLTASEMRKLFERCDDDDDGFISAKDLRWYMSGIGFEMSEEEATIILTSADHNEDDTVDLQQFSLLYNLLCSEDDRRPSLAEDAEDWDDDTSTDS